MSTHEKTHETEISIEAICDKDAVTKKAMELCNSENELCKPIVDKLLNEFMYSIENENTNPHIIINALSKVMIYLTQTLCENKEEFEGELSKAKNLVVSNFMPSLGIYSHDEVMNTNGVVTFNGVFDEDNLKTKRLLMFAGSFVEYLYWRFNLNEAIECLVGKN